MKEGDTAPPLSADLSFVSLREKKNQGGGNVKGGLQYLVGQVLKGRGKENQHAGRSLVFQ